ncbi:MAG: hypothetical protein A2504_09545 [Bdellovibrionales bacterium RIFOXYD12_FULL_39_22]|nr:MAG: hypothetical protein A2385_13035 [Bdellovibrionales bacterium RIFOXYB1_FULL_39_21]OFZ40970.1 MAG: hypothetical protein A2485_16545 [Bdellovibrionales bacterium RIFOXYC12_FULL_39_17]OFZ44798.1 MAG: hypothetical protein A2404_09835 [Bdellovibrionales bacterium RIFOXYC1_FULL_39_130]OFZ74263.1 MAG: hypothetical protein A2560_16800 [Bdellovibrionales bacterium RIFOXYD1_FULL_39_84]OFZ92127.1 MAG: hypothetical protein A2504_09545 [Bdellovibrionales bacterium RIFOXYD12_FULL_39_22]HLE12769.1 hy
MFFCRPVNLLLISSGTLNFAQCTHCHAEDDWKKIKRNSGKFSHNFDTNFIIDGAHTKIECDGCHKKNMKQIFSFPNARQQFCISCHPNLHNGQFPNLSTQKCSDCHSTSSFKKLLPFDHSITNFALKAKHTESACHKCHKVYQKQTYPKPYTSNPKRNYRFLFNSEDKCISCHKDQHNGEFGRSCTPCHNENSFKKTRDFHKSFLLSGIHFTLQCKECHFDDRILAGTGDNCQICHIKDDIHFGQLSQCSECHSQFFWEITNFKHTQTAFPLMGVHRTLECNECHFNGRYEATTSECVQCHQKERSNVAYPNHNLPGFTDCDECHNQFSFVGAH